MAILIIKENSAILVNWESIQVDFSLFVKARTTKRVIGKTNISIGGCTLYNNTIQQTIMFPFTYTNRFALNSIYNC